MKKYLALIAILVSALSLSAKKVMFQVDMTGVPVNVTGIHITGDFQVAAGFGGNNFDCNVMGMTQNSLDTNLYQLLVDIPAFQKYEFMFVNGDQCYEVEFVPSASRANYNFSDYRWIFIDSLSNDTTFLAPIQFSQNAPQNLTLIRFKINMQNEASISPNGVHTAGDFQGWNPAINRLYSFANNVYEWIAYVDTGNYAFRYYNGNLAANSENVPTACGVNGNRTAYVTQDTVMDVLCYASCTLCWPNSVLFNSLNTTRVYPNPGDGIFQVDAASDGQLQCYDLTGRCVFTQPIQTGLNTFQTPTSLKGLYMVRVVYNKQTAYTGKLIIR
jgi:hypothetical protein